MNVMWVAVFVLALPIVVPVTVYLAAKAGRYGYLRAEELFFKSRIKNDE